MATERTNVSVGGHTLSLSNLDKVLFPRDGYTKGDLIAYYRSVSEWILPYLRERPLTLQRWPDGIDKQSFFEKHLPKGLPDWAGRATITSPEGHRAKTTYVVCNDEATLVYVANLASIVLHVWTSRIETIEEPDYVFFDLDPGERCTIKTMAAVALGVRDLLASIGLTTLVKTSGGMGLHVVVPLASGYTYDAAKMFAEIVAQRLAHEDPARISLQRSVAKRDQQAVYFDYLQVGRGKTSVSAYSVRARDGAPVSTPLAWEEVEAFARKRSGTPWDTFAAFNLRTTPKRLEREGDLWGGKAWKKQRLEPAISKAQRAWS
ncbi:MAG TPA: non-homologous end-joining DNA ligase [Candidatus Baltobacteraceae bacterium]|nr:non-homologous end-joining DNA ligase [Candidatus Baltobacteraceae bacterium]